MIKGIAIQVLLLFFFKYILLAKIKATAFSIAEYLSDR